MWPEVGVGGLVSGPVCTHPSGTHIKVSHTSSLTLLSTGGVGGGSRCITSSWAESEEPVRVIIVCKQPLLSFPGAYKHICIFSNLATPLQPATFSA